MPKTDICRLTGQLHVYEPKEWPTPIRKEDLENLLSCQKALSDLIVKLNEIAQNKEFKNVWQFCDNHGFAYKGPNWVSEVGAAEKILEKFE